MNYICNDLVPALSVFNNYKYYKFVEQKQTSSNYNI